MRIAQLIFTGSIAALAALTAPALAKSSHTQKVDDVSFISFVNFTNMPRLPAGCRRNVDLATLPGKRQHVASTDAAQVCGAGAGGRRRALRAAGEAFRFTSPIRRGELRSNSGARLGTIR